MYRMLHKFVNPLIFGCGYRNNGGTEHIFHLIDINIPSVSYNLIHHIQGNNNRYLHLQKLHCKIEISLDVRRIHYIYDSFRLVIKDKIPRYEFFRRIRRHGIDSWKIRDKSIIITQYGSVLAVYRYSGKITDMLPGSCQLVK